MMSPASPWPRMARVVATVSDTRNSVLITSTLGNTENSSGERM
jgi:hypothetical protein